jgi:hypothetical protein
VGVYLCKDNTLTECSIFRDNIDILPSSINDQVGFIHFVNTASTVYGAVLHENKSREGSCEFYLSGGGDSTVTLPRGKASSLTVFKITSLSPEAGAGVSFYEKKEYAGTNFGTFKNVVNHNLNEKGKSIKIENGGEYIAIVESQDSKYCEVFRQSDPTVGENYIGKCSSISPSNWGNLGCFGKITVFPTKKI